MISNRTRATLVRVLSKQSAAEIGTLALEIGLGDKATGYTKHDQALALVGALFHEYQGEEAYHQGIILAEGLFRSLSIDSEEASELASALALDGLAYIDGRLIPTTPGVVTVDEQISVLERQLVAQGFDEAAKHYQQSIASFVAGHHEAANGQVRSFLESLFLGLSSRVGKEMQDASAALQHLRNVRWLDDGEWNHLRYFWNDIQDNGPHSGLTTPEEALFRLHYATAVARYLLTKK
jgi:hypothetical protein